MTFSLASTLFLCLPAISLATALLSSIPLSYSSILPQCFSAATALDSSNFGLTGSSSVGFTAAPICES